MGPDWRQETESLANISLWFELCETGYPHWELGIDHHTISHRAFVAAKILGIKKNHWCKKETVPQDSQINVVSNGLTATTAHDAFVEMAKDMTR